VDLRALERLLEAPDQLRAVEWMARLGAAEDEVGAVGVGGALAQLGERVPDAFGHRDRAARADRLRLLELASDKGRHDASLARRSRRRASADRAARPTTARRLQVGFT
jgi:hypothetical protein